VPTVVGGPYEYGVPGAVHGIFKPPVEAKPLTAGTLAVRRSQQVHGGPHGEETLE
jgi:cytochrome c oxidase subunit 1